MPRTEKEIGAPMTEANADHDDKLGMSWWNHLTERERAYWANLAETGRAKDAWEVFKASNGDGDRGSAA